MCGCGERERESSVSWAREWGCDWGEIVGVLVGRERERGVNGERERSMSEREGCVCGEREVSVAREWGCEWGERVEV